MDRVALRTKHYTSIFALSYRVHKLTLAFTADTIGSLDSTRRKRIMIG